MRQRWLFIPLHKKFHFGIEIHPVPHVIIIYSQVSFEASLFSEHFAPPWQNLSVLLSLLSRLMFLAGQDKLFMANHFTFNDGHRIIPSHSLFCLARIIKLFLTVLKIQANSLFYIPLCEFLLIQPEISCLSCSPALSKLSPKCPHQTQT